MKIKKQRINIYILIFIPFLLLGFVLIILFERSVNDFISYKNAQIKPKTVELNTNSNSKSLAGFIDTQNYAIQINDSNIYPELIRVRKDSKVILDIKVTEGYHNLIIEGYGVKSKRIPTNRSSKLIFIATQSGTFKIFSKTGMNINEPKESILIVE